MQRRTLLFFSTFALALFGDVRSGPLYKRFAGDGTFYNAGLGACGDTNSNDELVCAMNAPQYDGSCNKVVTITGPKGTTTCTIKDLCPECLFGSIDMSPAAFNRIADPDQGRVHISWSFGGSDDPEPTPQPTPQPAPPPPPKPQPSPPPPPPSPTPPPPQSVQKDQDDDSDDTDGDDNSTDSDSSATVNSVSYAFLACDFSLIDGGELEEGGNPLDDPEGYSDEIINKVTNGSDDADTDDDASDSDCNIDQSDDDGTDRSVDDDDDDGDDSRKSCGRAQPVTTED